MTKTEAIDILVGVIETHSEEENEALDIAIEALQESAEKYTNATTNLHNSRLAKDVMGISEEAEKLQLSEETSTISEKESVDCISRVDTVESLPPVNQKQVTSKLESAEIATLEGEESTMNQPKSKLDCISRQQAIEAIEKEIERIRENPCAFTEGDFYYQNALKLAQEIIELQPPVTPTDKVVDFNNMISAGGRIRNLPPVEDMRGDKE